jgi:hypothetical protein
MTEEEWLTAPDPRPLLESHQRLGRQGDRLGRSVALSSRKVPIGYLVADTFSTAEVVTPLLHVVLSHRAVGLQIRHPCVDVYQRIGLSRQNGRKWTDSPDRQSAASQSDSASITTASFGQDFCQSA